MCQASVGQPGEEESRGGELGEGSERKRPQPSRGEQLCVDTVEQYFIRWRSGGSGGTVGEVGGVEGRIWQSKSTKWTIPVRCSGRVSNSDSILSEVSFQIFLQESISPDVEQILWGIVKA